MFILFHSPFLFLIPTNKSKINIALKTVAIIILNIAIIQTGSRGAFLGLCVLYLLILADNKYRTKMIFTGDIQQIDTPYLDSKSNGLSYLTDRMKGQDIFAHVNLIKGERSYLAELASDLL